MIVVDDLLGRDVELDLVDHVVRRGLEGGVSLALAGDAGIGKTVLLSAAARVAADAGALVVTAVGVEAETHLPFAGLLQLVAPVLDDVAALPVDQRSALEGALGLSHAAPADVFFVAQAALDALGSAAARRPIALVVDDVQWLDQPTQDCLAYLARRVAGVPLCIVGTVRVEVDERVGFLDAVEQRVEIHGLDATTADVLVARTAPHLTHDERNDVLRFARGNPLALRELPETWQSDTSPDAEPVLSRRLEATFGGRFEQLPQATRDLLLVAAVDERRDLAEVLRAARVLVGEPLGVEELAPARRLGLLTRAEDVVEFRHPLVRSGILQRERPGRRLAAHAAVAAAVADDPYRRAWHRAQSIVGPDDDVADELEATVASSLRRGAVTSAIASLERAAQLTSTSRRRGRRLLQCAEHAFSLGRVDLVDRFVTAAVATDLDDLDRARAQWLREIFNDGVPGDSARVLELCDNARLAAAIGDRDLALNLLLGAGLRCWWADTGPAARARVATEIAELGAGDDPRAVAALSVAEPVDGAAAVTDALVRNPADRIADADALRLFGMAAHAIGDSPRADDYLCAAEAALRGQRRLGMLVHALSMHVIVLIELGGWERAAAASEEAMLLAEETGQPVWTVGSRICEAMYQALRGDLPTARALVADVEAAAYPRRLNDLLSCAQLTRGLIAIQDPAVRAPVDVLRQMFDRSSPTYHARECFGGLMFLAEAARATGDRAHAVEVLGELDAVAARTPSPILHVQLAYARPVLATGDEAEGLYRAALARDLERWPWVRARLRLAFGAWLVERGREPGAREVLEGVAEELQQLGASHWARAASRLEVDLSGGRS